VRDRAALWRALLPRLIAEIPRGSRIVFVSDLRWLREEHAAPLGLLASQQEVLVVEIVDPAELSLPNVGLAHFRDASRNAARWVDTGSRAVRAAFEQAAEARLNTQTQWLRRAGIAYLRVRTDEPAVDRVVEFDFRD
jgi:uncharacterized protein (DUF58 family)